MALAPSRATAASAAKGAAEAGTNAPEFSVSELSAALKRTVEDAYGHVRVRGELGRVTFHRNGHCYLDLKDDRAVLAGVVWKGSVPKLKIKPEQGLEVIATGRLTTFAGQSKYQIVIDSLEPAGVGALMALLEERRKKLTAEGLFDEARKRPLPYLPEVIGVITSPTGAVIRDILHRLADRFPRRVLVWPVAVQGEACAAQVTEAIEGFNALPEGGPVPRPDVLIVARGGGSVEDLWGFNEESVVRAAAGSGIPLISAVGHETDVTLVDFAADRRAPTPTAAAEMAVPVRSDLMRDVADKTRRLERYAETAVQIRRDTVVHLARALPRPDDVLGQADQLLANVTDRLGRGSRQRLDRGRQAVQIASGALRPQALLRLIATGRRELGALDARLGGSLSRRLARARDSLTELAARRRIGRLAAAVEDAADRESALALRLKGAEARLMRERTAALTGLCARLKAVGHEDTLARGYALVWTQEDRLARRAGSLTQGQGVHLQFADGRLAARIDGAEEGKDSKPVRTQDKGGTRAAAKPAASAAPKSGARKQTDLFEWDT